MTYLVIHAVDWGWFSGGHVGSLEEARAAIEVFRKNGGSCRSMIYSGELGQSLEFVEEVA